MRALGLSPADLEPRVSRSIPQIVEMIQRLIDRGYAYVSEGDVWFEVSRFERYGALSGQRLDKLQSSPDSGGGKRDSRDFALWKAAKPGEPAWSTPWGEGRPGWHIECSAMSRAALGGPIDIHGGGLDLCFPHHENEIAQSECAHEGRYASYWMHNGLLTTEAGNKIARSLGNGDTIREVLQRAPAEALRLYYLQAHYRSGLPWNDQALSSAICKLARLYEALEAAEALRTDAPVPERAPEGLQQALSLAVDFEAQLYAALDHDFNTACALGRAFELVRAFNHARSTVRSKKKLGPLARLVHEGLSLLPRTLGILSQRPETFERTVKADAPGSARAGRGVCSVAPDRAGACARRAGLSAGGRDPGGAGRAAAGDSGHAKGPSLARGDVTALATHAFRAHRESRWHQRLLITSIRS